MEEMTSVNTEMEVAEPSETSVAEEVETTETEVTTEDTASTSEPTVQSAEENAKYAAARRKAEQEFAERQRLEDLEYERRFKDYENPITHQPIRSRQDYFDALDAQEKLQMEQNLASGNVDVDTLNNYIEKQIANNPAVLQANAIMQANQQAQIESAINEGVKEIQKLDPSVKSIEDLMSADNAPQIVQYVNNGMSLVDAYKLANFDVLMANKTNATKQAAINNMKGTQHLGVTDGVTGKEDGGVEIPASELPVWRRAYPDLSLSELKKKYNKVL